MTRRLLFAVLASLPAVLLGSLSFISFEEGDYYTRPWQIAAVVFFVASFLFGMSIPRRQRADEFDSSSTIRTRLFAYPALAWMLAVAVLFGLSFTPLVLGQDNGDGTNSYAMCLFFAISSSVVYSAIVVPVILLNSFLLSPLLSFTRIKS